MSRHYTYAALSTHVVIVQPSYCAFTLVAVCQRRFHVWMRAGSSVRVSAHCFKGSEGGGDVPPEVQRRGVSLFAHCSFFCFVFSPPNLPFCSSMLYVHMHGLA